MDIVIVYDIADTEGSGGRRLRDLADICHSYGHRVQLSVFECRLSPERLQRLKGQILDTIEPAVDSVFIYEIHGGITGSRTVLGRKPPREVDSPWIL